MNIKKICEEGVSSERLCFRKLNIDDIQDIFECGSEEKSCRFLKWGPYTDIAQAETFAIEKSHNYQNPKDILFGIELKERKKLIGIIRIYNIMGERADISYILNSAFTGKGYMTESVKNIMDICFYRLGLTTVYAYFVEENICSEKVMINSGMKKDDKYEDFVVIKGEKRKLLRYKKEREN